MTQIKARQYEGAAIKTKDVSQYNGMMLSNISIPVNGSLDDVILGIDNEFTTILGLITNIELDTLQVVMADATTGSIVFAAGLELQVVIQGLCDIIVGLDSDLAALNDVDIASTFTFVNLAGTINDLYDLEDALDTFVGTVQTYISTNPTPASLALLESDIAALTTDFVLSGYGSSNVLLRVTIASGVSYTVGKRTVFAGDDIDIEASKDNYIYIDDSLTGVLSYKSVTIGNPAPATDAGTQLLWLATTNGTTVTSFIDNRNLNYVKVGAIGINQLAAGSVTTAALESVIVAGAEDYPAITYDAKGRVTIVNSKYNYTGLANKDISWWDSGTSKWINKTIYPNILPTGADGQSLVYASGVVTASFLSFASLADFGTGPVSDYDFLIWDTTSGLYTNKRFWNRQLKIANYTMVKDDWLIAADSTTLALRFTLANPTLVPVGIPITIKDEYGNASVNNITVLCPGVVTIDGVGSLLITTDYGSLTFYSDGTNYFTV